MPEELAPTFHGYILSNEDALYVVEAALANKFPLVYRRPLDSERPHLIRLGNVFVFIEESSDIKRWTDGISWSASRILGRFLIYRKLDRSANLTKGDKKKSKNGKRKSSKDAAFSSEDDFEDRRLRVTSVPMTSDIYSHYDNIDLQNSHGRESFKTIGGHHWRPLSPETPSSISVDRGLIKKTLSLAIPASESDTGKPKTVHLISYFSAYDVLAGNLVRPSQTELRNTEISSTLWLAIRKSSLGGKLLAESEANFYLDSRYQLQNMTLMVHDDKSHHPFDQNTKGHFRNGPQRRYSSVYSADSFKVTPPNEPAIAPSGTLFRTPFNAPLSAPTEPTQHTMGSTYSLPENAPHFKTESDFEGPRKKRRSSKPYSLNHPCSSDENMHSDVNTRDVQYSEQPQIHSGVMHNYAPLSLHHPHFGESHGDYKPDLHMAPPAFSGVPTWNPTYSGLESGSGMHSSPFYHGIREDHVGGHEYEPYSSPAVAPTLSNRAFGVQVSQQPHQKPSVFNNMQTYSYLPQQRWDSYSNTGQVSVSAPLHEIVNEHMEYDHHGVYE